MLAAISANRRVILGELWVWRFVLLSCSYVQQRLLLMGEWASVPLNRHMVFPTRSRRVVVLSSPRGHCWMRTAFLSAAIKSAFQACADFASCQRFLRTATLLDFFKTFIFLFSNPHKYLIWYNSEQKGLKKLHKKCKYKHAQFPNL